MSDIENHNYKTEKARLDTFYGSVPWTVPFIEPQECAKAGFFYFADGDKLQCPFCRGVAGEWQQGDDPLAEHKRHFPKCPFICSLPVGNIPIGHEEEAAARLHEDQQSPAFGVDVCGSVELSVRPYAGPSQVHVRGALLLNGEVDDVANSLAIKTGSGPTNKNFVTLQSRQKSFTNWPGTSGQFAEKMAEAGFYYIGVRGHVKCFYCDGGLRDWEECDDPWEEHARWFSACPYVVLSKGEEFITKASQSKLPIIPSSSFKPSPGWNSSRTAQPRSVADVELRQLMDIPIVKAPLEMGIDVGKLKRALQRKLQQTGTPFQTTEALLEAVLGPGHDPEYESDTDSCENGSYEEEDLASTCNKTSNTNTSAVATILANMCAQSSSALQEATSTDVSPPVVGTLTLSSSVESWSSSGGEDVVGLKHTTTMSLNRDSGASSAEYLLVDDEHNESEGGRQQLIHVTKALELKEEEIRKLREARQCKICMDNEVEAVFLPCGHLVSCVSCATALSNCALCRQPINAAVRTYLS